MKKLFTLCVLLAGVLTGQAAVEMGLTPVIPAITNPGPSRNMKKAANYAAEVVVNNVKYGIDLEMGMAVVLGLDDDVIDLNIEESINYEGFTFPVEEVARMAFNGNEIIETVHFPTHLAKIGSWSFQNCASLQSVEIPEGCEVDSMAFGQCISLANVTIGEEAKLNYGAFYKDVALTSVTIPATVTALGRYCFNECTNLKHVTMQGDYMSFIGYGCFMKSGIEELNLPATVDQIEACLAYDCSSLKSITLPTNLETVPAQAFTMCTSISSVYLPENYTKLGQESFYMNSSLTSINLENITEFPRMCLVQCVNLAINLEMNDNTTYIGEQAFARGAIKSVKTGSKTTTIDNFAFLEDAGLKKVTLLEGLQTIGRWAFAGVGAEKIVIPSTVTRVDGGAFVNSNGINSGLRTLVCLATTPPSMENPGDLVNDYSIVTLYVPDASIEAYQAAEYWKKFTNVLPVSELPNVEEVTIDGIVYELDLDTGKATLIDGAAATGDFVVPNTIAHDRASFTVVGIGKGAFDENTNLTSITLNEDLETIGDDAFQYSSIPSLHLPAKVQSVGHDFHYKATSLAEITVDENNPYLCAENSLLMSKDKKVVWGFPVANPATELILPEEVEIVKSDAVNRCKKLLTIVINDNCKTIEKEAFDNCTSCTSLTMGKGIEYVGEQAFRSFKSITELTLPDNLIEIGRHGFGWCQNLKTITFNEKLEKIGNIAFYHNDALEVVDLPASVTYIDAYAFNTCDAITEFRCRATVPPQVITDLWEPQDHYINIPLRVPAGCEEAYANAPVWQKFTTIEALPTTAIDAVETAADATVVGIYTIDGKRLSEMRSGVNILRMSDGTSRKVIK
jgi:hypothetical protein